MTKTEFQLAACKAGIKPELYGAVLSERFSSLDGPVAGGKVAGIAWLDGWKTESRYSCMRGEFEEEFLSKEPYVVLKKDRKTYRVHAAHVIAYVDEQCRKWLAAKVKTGEAI